MRTASTLLSKLQAEGMKEGKLKLEGLELQNAVRELGLEGRIVGNHRFKVQWESRSGQKSAAFLEIVEL